MRCPRVALFAIVLTIAGSAASDAQTRTPAPAPSPFHLTLSAATLAGLPRITLSATDEHGNTDTYSGVSLEDAIVRAGAPHGEAVRGKAMMSSVVIGAADGYHVFFALPELDASYTDHVVLIADTMHGAALPSGSGPYRLIVPFEKRQARWVKSVTDIELVNQPLP